MFQLIRSKLILEIAILMLLVLAIAVPRLVEVAQFTTPDEYMWLTRSANFLDALANQDFTSTYQKEHPGVTVMWVGAANMFRIYPSYIERQSGQFDPDEFHAFMSGKDVPITLLELLRDSRLMMVVVHITILVVSYFYARRLLGTIPALLGFTLIAFDPFHLGLTRLLHLDGLMTNLILLALLAFLAYIFDKRGVDLFVSGLAAGLSWLTKSPALFLFPVMGVLVMWEPWQAFRKRELSVNVLWPPVLIMIIWALIGVAVFIALWPAMWVAPMRILQEVFSMAQEFAEAGHESALYFNGKVIPDGNIGLEYFYFYPVTYLWRSTPAVLVGLVLAMLGYCTRREPFVRPQARVTVFALALTALLFAAVMTLGDKKFDRYLLPAYPLFDIIAGLGWYGLAIVLGNRYRSGLLRYAQPLLLVAVIGMQAYSAWSTFPYYLSYYNPLMGGSRKAPQVMQVGWGEGLDQAARYLNQKPNVKQLKVISWYATGPFSYYFEGNDRSFWYRVDATPDEWDKFVTSDYAVIYIGQWQREIPKPVLDYVSKLKPEHSIWIDGLEYARIYKLP